MVEVRRKRHGLSYTQKWFAREAGAGELGRFVVYYQYLGETPPRRFVRRPYSTAVVDLSHGSDAILEGMNKHTRHHVRRAEQDGLSWERDVPAEEFAAFHAAFAREKGIEGVDERRLASYGEHILLTRVRREGRVLAQHAYIVDRDEKRARFLYSSSGRFEGEGAAVVGRANRWCHWKDMLWLQDSGIVSYDLGGIAEGATDPALVGINEFKFELGGVLVREDHWLSPLYALVGRLGLQ
jgi:hypothetical protein